MAFDKSECVLTEAGYEAPPLVEPSNRRKQLDDIDVLLNRAQSDGTQSVAYLKGLQTRANTLRLEYWQNCEAAAEALIRGRFTVAANAAAKYDVETTDVFEILPRVEAEMKEGLR